MCYSNNIPMTFLDLHIDWDRVAKQKQSYNELNNFKPGDSGQITYYPVPKEELKDWIEKNKPVKS